MQTQAIAINKSAVDVFKTGLRGKLIQPGDAEYDTSRTIFNAMIDKHPALIAKCAGVADVIKSVNFARENHLPLAVKGGGHNVAGNAMCDDGLVIDFSNMKSIRIDPAKRIARAEPGLTWGEFDHETQAFGLAVTGGLNSTTGIAGFTLGGGIGWLQSKYGLTCDNLLSADVVTADGKLLVASEKENEDLFWAIRGGGGNFGVVTSFKFQLHPVSTLLCGPVVHPLERAEEVLRFLREYNRSIPDELQTSVMFRPNPAGAQIVGISAVYPGTLEEGERIVGPIRKFAAPIADFLKPRPYAELQKLVDDAWPHGLYCYWKAGYIEDLSDGAINVIVSYAENKPSPLSIIAMLYQHGAVSQVKPDATAFNHRILGYILNIQAQWRESADTEKNLNWIRDFWSAIKPYMSNRVYVNFLSQEGEERVKNAYGENYERLARLKKKYDPSNLFHLNQNIKPA